ncbi:hypothetical protein P4O66_002325 [Electrophorus voltai]|uniref:Uncharacterized protein n=1 Tax=Electrophorus voltai TaxID=2609070 RepID=A0AAD9DRG2_9TELE|nr:hypothetical protein P4O66_002325 [Electrophorus voltai]
MVLFLILSRADELCPDPFQQPDYTQDYTTQKPRRPFSSRSCQAGGLPAGSRIVKTKQWCDMVPCLEDEGCDLLANRSGWTCTQPGGRVKTTTSLCAALSCFSWSVNFTKTGHFSNTAVTCMPRCCEENNTDKRVRDRENMFSSKPCMLWQNFI